MKQILYTVLACMSVLLSSCMGKDYAEAGYDENPYGNNTLTESNVVSIAQLKERYAGSISTTNAYEQVTSDLQIKGVVTSSDAAGNIYNEVAVQDETGAILISVSQGGIYGYLPVGTEVLVELKGLYVGNYGLQAQIGVPATSSSGQTSIGRLPRALWDQHYKILSTGNKVEPTLLQRVVRRPNGHSRRMRVSLAFLRTFLSASLALTQPMPMLTQVPVLCHGASRNKVAM